MSDREAGVGRTLQMLRLAGGIGPVDMTRRTVQ
jgi:hypothetical protein